jgi:hypothetical protein
MQRLGSFIPLAALAAAVFCFVVASMARAATTENFQVRTTADFVALCDTDPGEENYVAAVHFCQGFASGAYQYYLAVAQHDPRARYVCVTEPAPSRNQAIANFVTWANANPNVLSEPAVESIFRHLAQTYPCSEAQRTPTGDQQ